MAEARLPTLLPSQPPPPKAESFTLPSPRFLPETLADGKGPESEESGRLPLALAASRPVCLCACPCAEGGTPQQHLQGEQGLRCPDPLVLTQTRRRDARRGLSPRVQPGGCGFRPKSEKATFPPFPVPLRSRRPGLFLPQPRRGCAGAGRSAEPPPGGGGAGPPGGLRPLPRGQSHRRSGPERSRKKSRARKKRLP